MSLIVAIKDKDRVVVGADKQISTSYNCDHTCTKIWTIPELPGAIMGGVGSARANQIIQYSSVIDRNEWADDYDELSIVYVINSLVPSIVGALKARGFACGQYSDDPDMPSQTTIPNSFLFAYGSKAWMIWNDLSVTEVTDYMAIGSGSDVAKGVLYATKKADPFKRIVTCIDAAAESTLYVDHGVDLLATYIEDEDTELINAAFEEEKPVEEKKPVKKSTSKKTTTKKSTTKKSSTSKTTKKEEK